MAAPGGLTELGDDANAWEAAVTEVIQGVEPSLHLMAADPKETTELRIPDWPAVPARIRACLGRERADRLFDARDVSGDVGRQSFHEEYAEWRLVRDEHGAVRFELTTELADYWELLAGYAPQVALDLIGTFARESVAPSDIFGDHDPFGAKSTPDERIAGFRAQLLGRDRRGSPAGRPGPFNDGSKAITCLVRHDNTLQALFNLVSAAASPQLVIDAESNEPRFPSGSEAIPHLRSKSAQDCRNSDPVIVERIVRLATEGRLIRFDDPIGIYILDVQDHELLMPDGAPLPGEWFKRSRQGIQAADGLSRHQRLELEIPAEAGFSLSDVRTRRTGRPITRGAQIAELVQLGIYLRVSGRGQVPVSVSPRPSTPLSPCSEHSSCEELRTEIQALEEIIT